MNLYQIRNILATGKKLIELPLRVTFYARVSTDHEEQLNSLENQVMYFENYIKDIKKFYDFYNKDDFINKGQGLSLKNFSEYFKDNYVLFQAYNLNIENTRVKYRQILISKFDNITKYSVEDPTLNEIFLNVVGDSYDK